MDFWGLKGKTFLVTGVANKKSIANFVVQNLLDCGANVYLSVQSSDHQKMAQKIYPHLPSVIVDVTKEDSLKDLGFFLKENNIKLNGLVHSLAFARFTLKEDGTPPLYHEVGLADLLEASTISCFSLGLLANAVKDSLDHQASVVTLSISNTKATSYGYLGPIKAALETSVSYLAKSFSGFSQIRFNAVCAGPLKTSASAGIPNYIENYVFSEQLTMRKLALKTQEVADVVTYLLSPRSSGINATGLLVDAGMSSNMFDQDVVRAATKELL